MARQKKAGNPFYVMLVAVGILFTISASCYFVVALRQSGRVEVSEAQTGFFFQLFDEHGTAVLAVELGLLAVATFAAIGTDEYWEKRARDANSLAASVDASADAPDEPPLS